MLGVYRLAGTVALSTSQQGAEDVSPKLEEALPKYVQVATYIRDQITRGELQPGEEVPSERQIAEEWGVSRPTATRALALLRVEGLVDSRQGAGTFVRAQPQIYRRALDRYVRSRTTGRMYTSQERSEITEAGWTAAPEEVALALGLELEAMVIRRRRVTYDQAAPVEASTSWFDAELAQAAPRLLERSRIREGTLAYVEKMTGRKGTTAEDRYSARLATPEEAAELQLGDEPAAVGRVHHTVYDASGKPIEFAEAVYPPGRWTFREQYAIPT
jgi:DNA-binding GntR family transcriptional regulator